jgi:cyclase
MKCIRIIPRLDIKGPNLVKGVHLEGLRVLGKPEDFSFKYYEDGADELIYMDVVASLYGRNTLLDIVRLTAEYIFIPLTVGGGIKTYKDISDILRAGADKVAINTAAINNPNLVTEAARKFGSQCIVVSIEAKKLGQDHYEAYTDNGRERTGKDVIEWAKEVVALGAGEILITSIDHEGTGKGFDNILVSEISKMVPIPVIACGGAGNLNHFIDVVKEGNADAVCASSMFHYNRVNDLVLEKEKNYSKEGNIEFLKKNKSEKMYLSKIIKPSNIKDVKQTLRDKAGVICRPEQ